MEKGKPKWLIGFKLLIVWVVVALFVMVLSFFHPLGGTFSIFLPILLLVIFIEPIYDFIHGKGAFRQWLNKHNKKK